MIALLRSTDGNPDSRFEKYVNFLDSESIPNITICWDRYNVKCPTENRLFYKRESKYGLRFKNMTALLGFNWFILKSLIKHRRKYQVIHAADFDTVLPAMVMKLLYGKKVIYDIYDWYIDSRSINNPLFKWAVTQLERINVKKSDAVIICEEGRKNQIMFKPKKLWILPNIPSLNIPSDVYIAKDKITISYVGVLGSGRGLLNLIRLAQEMPEVNFIVGGFGQLEKDFAAANQLPNFNFRGRVAYDEALKIMSSSDLIYAMYERVNPNHILAAPNKYYEGLALGRPIITTEGTLVGDKVEKYDTGYCIDEKYECLYNLVKGLNRDEIIKKSAKASGLWRSKYRCYVADFMKNTYFKFIQKG